MSLAMPRVIVLVGVVCLAAACSQPAQGPAGDAAPSAAGNHSAPASAAANARAAAPPGTICERKLLDVADASGVLSAPITGTKSLPGDAQSCYFTTADEGTDLRLTLRPGTGDATIASFTSGHMNAFAKWQALSGVGDQAVWKPELVEISATKNNVLCEIAPGAGALSLSAELRSAGVAAQQQKLGALCNEIFAHYFGDAVAAPAKIGVAAGGNVLEPACDKEIAPTDVAGILTAPVVRQAGLNPQSCSYHAGAGATVTISLAAGDEGKFAWDVAANPANGRMDAFAGAGDSALQGHGGTVVVARNGPLVCSVDVTGTDNANGMKAVTPARGEELARKLAALCSKVFASRG